jgi:serine/threonine protein kinase
MSPEQSVGDMERPGPRSDVYSLGATLYCLLSGGIVLIGREQGKTEA